MVPLEEVQTQTVNHTADDGEDDVHAVGDDNEDRSDDKGKFICKIVGHACDDCSCEAEGVDTKVGEDICEYRDGAHDDEEEVCDAIFDDRRCCCEEKPCNH